MKLDTKNRMNFGRLTNMQKLNKKLQNNEWVKEEITRKNGKYCEIIENKNIIYQISRDAARAVLGRKFITINTY